MLPFVPTQFKTDNLPTTKKITTKPTPSPKYSIDYLKYIYSLLYYKIHQCVYYTKRNLSISENSMCFLTSHINGFHKAAVAKQFKSCSLTRNNCILITSKLPQSTGNIRKPY